MNLSQFSTEKVSFTGFGIAFWDSNYFNYANFLEVKIEYILNELIAEPVPVFAGWITKKKDSFDVKRNERSDTVKFDVWSYPDYADEVWASSLVAQYVDDDIDGAGSDGLMLPHIPNLFVTDANVSSFVLKKGVHTIGYQVTDIPEKQAKLDDGDWVTLSTGLNTLINSAGDQKVTVYARASIPVSGALSDDVVVNVPGDTFPKNWHTWISAASILKALFAKIGITNVVFDTLNYNTSTGGRKISFIDCPPQDLSITGNRFALFGVPPNIYVGVGNKLVKRDMATNSYEVMYTFGPNEIIVKMLYNARNDHLWICYGTSALFTKIRRYTVGANSMSAEMVLPYSSSFNAVAIMDYVYGGSNYKYCLCYIRDYQLREIDGDSLADTLVWTTTEYAQPLLLYIKNGNELYASVSDGWDIKIRKLVTDGESWSDSGFLAHSIPNVIIPNFVGAYHEVEDKLYYYTGTEVYAWVPGSASASFVFAPTVFAGPLMMYYSCNALFTTMGSAPGKYRLYSLSAGVATLEDANTLVCSKYGQIFYDGSSCFGLDGIGRLFQFDTTVVLYVETADFEGMTVRAAIEKMCNSFNLLYKISTTKSARIERRSDDNGNVITSGDSVTLTADNMRDVSDESFYGDAYDIVKISNGNREVSYDGSVFDAVAFDKEKVLEIDSDWIPDEILEDLAFNLYKFFSVYHRVYILPSPAALMQFECLDGADIVNAGKMTLNEAGVIVSDSVDNVGRREFKVLVNA